MKNNFYRWFLSAAISVLFIAASAHGQSSYTLVRMDAPPQGASAGVPLPDSVRGLSCPTPQVCFALIRNDADDGFSLGYDGDRELYLRPGRTEEASIQVGRFGRFNGSVNLTCSAPSEIGCNLEPNMDTPDRYKLTVWELNNGAGPSYGTVQSYAQTENTVQDASYVQDQNNTQTQDAVVTVSASAPSDPYLPNREVSVSVKLFP